MDIGADGVGRQSLRHGGFDHFHIAVYAGMPHSITTPRSAAARTSGRFPALSSMDSGFPLKAWVDRNGTWGGNERATDMNHEPGAGLVAAALLMARGASQ